MQDFLSDNIIQSRVKSSQLIPLNVSDYGWIQWTVWVPNVLYRYTNGTRNFVQHTTSTVLFNNTVLVKFQYAHKNMLVYNVSTLSLWPRSTHWSLPPSPSKWLVILASSHKLVKWEVDTFVSQPTVSAISNK